MNLQASQIHQDLKSGSQTLQPNVPGVAAMVPLPIAPSFLCCKPEYWNTRLENESTEMKISKNALGTLNSTLYPQLECVEVQSSVTALFS